MKWIAWAMAMSACCAGAGTTESTIDHYYEAIRNNNTAELAKLVKSDVNTGDKRGTTPLMYAAAFGSVQAMRMLLAAGADPNAKNAFDATALMWCATDVNKVRLLVESGANVNAQSKQGRTPLIVAASSDRTYPVVKYLLDHGAKVAAKDGQLQDALSAAAFGNNGDAAQLLLVRGADAKTKDVWGTTALMWAASQGNVELVRALLGKGADVNAVTREETGPGVKNGPIALGAFTPLILAAAYAGPETVKMLLDAGAKIDAADVRGMTPLMLAIATDRANPDTIRLLVERGASKTMKAKDGETAADWAGKFQDPRVLEALGLSRARASEPLATVNVADSKPVPVSAAVGKSLGLLGRTAGSFFQEGGCAACHAQNLTGMAMAAARENGYPVNQAAIAEGLKGLKLGWSGFEQLLLQRMDAPGSSDMVDYALCDMAAAGSGSDRITDAMIHNIAALQTKQGNWHSGAVARPPMEDGDFARTAFSIRTLRVFGIPARQAEFSDRIGNAAKWLKNAVPVSTEDRTMQLLGLKWAGADAATLSGLRMRLVAMQRADGGWAQTSYLASDAYATGQVLYALHEAGVPASDPAYSRGVEFLTRTQLADGSWHVKSRAPKFQPYFQSGFPHDHDQWISAAATAWATIGLAYAGPPAAEVRAAQLH